MPDVRELIVVGGGPAGYTAALYAARSNLSPLVIEGFAFGGQLMITSDVENYPGFRDGIMGPELMATMRAQAERFGAEMLSDDVTRVDFSSRPFRVYVGDDEYQAKAVIVATGATARQLGLESEVSLQGRGVSYCAVCDAAFFKGQDVVVVGGGDSAMEEEFVTNAVVTEVLGEDGRMTGVRLRDTVTDEEREIAAGGLFVAIGHDPTTGLFKDVLEMDSEGYLLTRGGSTETNIEGVFAAGDVVDHVYRQAVTAAGMGCMAALDAERWLSHAQGAATAEAAV